MPIPTIPRCLRYDIDESILDTSTRDNLERISQTLVEHLSNVDRSTLRDVLQNSPLDETVERIRAGVEDHREGYCRVHHSEPREVIQEAPVDDPDDEAIQDRYASYLRDIVTCNSLADLAARSSLDLSDNLTSIPRYTADDTYWEARFRKEELERIKILLRSGAAIRYRIEVK